MRITIAERLKPFSHLPGTQILLPKSTIVVEVFPTLIKAGGIEIPLNLSGPVKEFTVQLDLEKGCIWMWGFYKEGYHRFCLWSDKSKLKVSRVRGLQKEETPSFTPSLHERISLGSHKKQDWCLVRRRSDLKEVIPHWLKLAQFLPEIERHDQGIVGLLERISIDKNCVYDELNDLFQLGFDGILHPLLEDNLYRGINIPTLQGNFSPLALIAQGAELIRGLFIKAESDISILPCLPPQFHCGRFISIDLGNIGTLDIEWSKKVIRRMIFSSAIDQDQTFQFQKEVQSFRLRNESSVKGMVVPAGSPLSFKSKGTYFFDCFER